MWNLLGPRPINMLVWDSFSLDWANDIQSQLKLENVHIFKVDYGKLPDLTKNQFKGDIVLTGMVQLLEFVCQMQIGSILRGMV